MQAFSATTKGVPTDSRRKAIAQLVPLRIIRDDDGDYVMFWAVPLLRCGECVGCTIDTYVLLVRDELPAGLRRA